MKTFLAMLYGSQYQELAQQGKNGLHGRLNGNLFLSAAIMVALLVILLLSGRLLGNFGPWLEPLSGLISGASLGKLLALPLFFGIYALISRTVGSYERFVAAVEAFQQLPAHQQGQANRRILLPFFSLLGLLLALALWP